MYYNYLLYLLYFSTFTVNKVDHTQLPGMSFLPRNHHETSGRGVPLATHCSKQVPLSF